MKQRVELTCYRPNGEIALVAEYQNMDKAIEAKAVILEGNPNYRVELNPRPEAQCVGGV